MMTIREMKKLLQVYKIKYNLPDITFDIKKVRGGRARIKTKKITIPIWVLNTVKQYQVWYVLHEITHFIQYQKSGYTNHDNAFKKLETDIARAYNIIPIYSKAYPKYLTDLEGNILCDKYGEGY